MATEAVRPFLAGQRHDVLLQLVAGRNELIQQNIVVVARGIDPHVPKLDGKGGAADGVIGVLNHGDIASYVPICGAYPGPKIEHPKGKEGGQGAEGLQGGQGGQGLQGLQGRRQGHATGPKVAPAG